VTGSVPYTSAPYSINMLTQTGILEIANESSVSFNSVPIYSEGGGGAIQVRCFLGFQQRTKRRWGRRGNSGSWLFRVSIVDQCTMGEEGQFRYVAFRFSIVDQCAIGEEAILVRFFFFFLLFFPQLRGAGGAALHTAQ
jgi:hypothetical protein